MKKTIALLAAAVLAVVVVAKTTSLGSYVGTLCSRAKASIKDSVPTEFDIDRIDREIANLDQKLKDMYLPIAEHQVAVNNLRKDIEKREVKQKERKEVLLAAIANVKQAKKGDRLIYGGKPFTADQVTRRIALDNDQYKRHEAFIAAERKRLEAREATLQAAQEQYQTFLAKRDEFRVQLAQLRAEHEVNKLNAVGTNIDIDATPLAAIGQSLEELKTRIEVQRAQLELQSNFTVVNGIQLNQPHQAVAVDLDAIQANLENGNAPAKATSTSTASNK
jgi:septal ring factor EnvC (AmiA/AmiB activator)